MTGAGYHGPSRSAGRRRVRKRGRGARSVGGHRVWMSACAIAAYASSVGFYLARFLRNRFCFN